MLYWLACVCIDDALGSSLSARAYRRLPRDGRLVGAHAGITARRDPGHQCWLCRDYRRCRGPCSDRRKQCTGGYTHLCAVRASHKLCIDAARPRSSRGVQASAWPAGGLQADLPESSRVPGYQESEGPRTPAQSLVITHDRIRPGTAVGAPTSEPPAYASESSVSGQLLVMCVPGACGVAGTVCGSCACEMGLLCALVITTRTNYR